MKEQITQKLCKICTAGIQGKIPDKSDLVCLLSLEDFSPVYKLANEICERNFGKVVNIRAILEFSNHCKRLCKYCGLNAKNQNITRYTMSEKDIIYTSKKAYDAGYKTIVLQSGEDTHFTAGKIGSVIKKIKSLCDIKVTVSTGEMSCEDYSYIRECGADRYLLKHETSDEKIYAELHEDYSLKRRIKCLYDLKKLGFETGSGFMIGLPNQTLDTIAEDLITLAKIPCDMAGIGPFIPHPDTELANVPAGSTELTKRAVALARIILPKANLPATTSLGVISSDEKNDIFSCGANVIMRKVTPQIYEKHYNIYPSDIKVTDISEQRKQLEDDIKSLGKIPI